MTYGVNAYSAQWLLKTYGSLEAFKKQQTTDAKAVAVLGNEAAVSGFGSTWTETQARILAGDPSAL